MGDMADDLRHQEVMSEIKAEDYNMGIYFYTSPPKRKKLLWRTAGTNGCNGKTIEIKDMSTSHIVNSIAKCKRDNWRLEAIPYLEAELKRRDYDCEREDSRTWTL